MKQRLIRVLKRVFNRESYPQVETDHSHTCRAVTDDGTICGDPAIGEMNSEIAYCESHAPSGSQPGLSRVEPVTFQRSDGEVVTPSR